MWRVERGIGGLIDLPHATLADEGGDEVVPEAGTSQARGRELCLDL